MKTDALVKALAADTAKPGPSPRVVWTGATLLAIAAAAAMFFAVLGPRPDIAAAAGTARFLFKFVFTLALAGAAFGLLRTLARPGAPVARVAPWLLLAPVLVAVAVLAELVSVPASDWGARLVGTNRLACLLSIPLIGLGPLVIALVALRQGAPTRPRIAGAVAGLVAGGLAATFYAAHCTDDSPLFVAVWYSLAIAALAVLGSLLGPRIARW